MSKKLKNIAINKVGNTRVKEQKDKNILNKTISKKKNKKMMLKKLHDLDKECDSFSSELIQLKNLLDKKSKRKHKLENSCIENKKNDISEEKIVKKLKMKSREKNEKKDSQKVAESTFLDDSKEINCLKSGDNLMELTKDKLKRKKNKMSISDDALNEEECTKKKKNKKNKKV